MNTAIQNYADASRPGLMAIDPRRWSLRDWITLVAILGVTFQIGHFIEHAVQFGVWLFGDRQAPWMSGVAMWLTETLGRALLGMPEGSMNMGAVHGRQMMVGMEVLHLIGNGIFLVTIAAICYLSRSKWVRYALYVETFHFYEHIMLVSTAVFLGKPVGFSTLFGGTAYFFDKEGIVGCRVAWHFVMNLIPSALLMVPLMQRATAPK
jgi:hypothetical protein